MNEKKWGFVSDYMRLDIIYKYGGIYLDTDIEMIKKPDQLLYQECFGCVGFFNDNEFRIRIWCNT